VRSKAGVYALPTSPRTPATASSFTPKGPGEGGGRPDQTNILGKWTPSPWPRARFAQPCAREWGAGGGVSSLNTSAYACCIAHCCLFSPRVVFGRGIRRRRQELVFGASPAGAPAAARACARSILDALRAIYQFPSLMPSFGPARLLWLPPDLSLSAGRVGACLSRPPHGTSSRTPGRKIRVSAAHE